MAGRRPVCDPLAAGAARPSDRGARGTRVARARPVVGRRRHERGITQLHSRAALPRRRAAASLRARDLDRLREPGLRPGRGQPHPSLHKSPRGVLRARHALLRCRRPLAPELHRDDLGRDLGGDRRLLRTAPRAEHLLPGQGGPPAVAKLLGEHAARLLPAGFPQSQPGLHRPPRAGHLLRRHPTQLRPLGRAARHGAEGAARARAGDEHAAGVCDRGPER